MKIRERTGKWLEIDRSSDSHREITIQASNSLWAGWLAPIHIREEDLAAFLRSAGWTVAIPGTPAEHEGCRPYTGTNQVQNR